jgi:hypothetical protein
MVRVWTLKGIRTNTFRYTIYIVPIISSSQDFRDTPFVAEIDTWSKQVSELTAARLTYPVSRQYNIAVGIRGRLDKKSTEQLIMLYNQYAPKFHWQESIRPVPRFNFATVLDVASFAPRSPSSCTQLTTIFEALVLAT